MVATLTQFLDNLYTTTWQNRMEGVADNVFNAHARAVSPLLIPAP